MILYIITLLPPYDNVQCRIAAYHYTLTMRDGVHQGSVIMQMKQYSDTYRSYTVTFIAPMSVSHSSYHRRSFFRGPFVTGNSRSSTQKQVLFARSSTEYCHPYQS